MSSSRINGLVEVDAHKQTATLDQDGHPHADSLSPFERAAAQPIPRQSLSPQLPDKRNGILDLLRCSCLCPAAPSGQQAHPGSSIQAAGTAAAPHRGLAGCAFSQQPSGSHFGQLMERLSRHKVRPAGSCAFSDAEWQDAVSNFSSSAEQAAMLEEMQVRSRSS